MRVISDDHRFVMPGCRKIQSIPGTISNSKAKEHKPIHHVFLNETPKMTSDVQQQEVE